MMTDNWMWGTTYGLTHWIIFVVMVAVVLYPTGRILRRLGLSPFWSVLVFVPLVNLISLWVLAFSDWPVDEAIEQNRVLLRATISGDKTAKSVHGAAQTFGLDNRHLACPEKIAELRFRRDRHGWKASRRRRRSESVFRACRPAQDRTFPFSPKKGLEL